ncbi:MAG TPA: LysE family transporter [Thermohalobaculum sp.]|nr:LysE family transporter [Thermohalobaculum sp.]
MPSPWPEIATALVFFGANVLSPGPNVFNTIAIALGSGRRAALAVVPAVALGVLIWSSAAVLGAAVAFRRFPALEPALTGLGGLLLLWFAARYLCRAWHWSAEIGRNRVVSPRAAFAITLGILATNPKALTTWLVLVSIFPAGTAGPAGIAAMILGAALVAALGHLAYALAFSSRRAALAYARAGRWINFGVGLFFGALGITLLLSVAGLTR